MTRLFGVQPVTVVIDAAGLLQDSVEHMRNRLAGVVHSGSAELLMTGARPTAAFSRRDTLRPGYPEAREEVRARGFASVVRPVGGHLAVYDEGALVVHLSSAHPEPRNDVRARFEVLSGAMAHALRTLGVDARVGAVPGEYCDGEFSVSCAGRTKLVGTGQRIIRGGFLFSAVVTVTEVGPVREALEATYATLGLEFRPDSVGFVADSVPGVSVEEVRGALLTSLQRVLPAGPTLRQGLAAEHGSVSHDPRPARDGGLSARAEEVLDRPQRSRPCYA